MELERFLKIVALIVALAIWEVTVIFPILPFLPWPCMVMHALIAGSILGGVVIYIDDRDAVLRKREEVNKTVCAGCGTALNSGNRRNIIHNNCDGDKIISKVTIVVCSECADKAGLAGGGEYDLSTKEVGDKDKEDTKCS